MDLNEIINPQKLFPTKIRPRNHNGTVNVRTTVTAGKLMQVLAMLTRIYGKDNILKVRIEECTDSVVKSPCSATNVLTRADFNPNLAQFAAIALKESF